MKNLLYTLTLFAALSPSAGAMNLEIREGRPVVNGVYINGQGPYRFLLDTGSTLNHIDPGVAKKIGLSETIHANLTCSTGVIAVSGSSGIAVVVGPARAENQTFLFGLGAVRQVWSDIAGILGEDFLSRFDYLLDLRHGRLEFGAREPGVKSLQLPYRLDHGRPMVSTSLGWLVVDSGANRITRFGIETAQASLAMQTVAGITKLGTVSSTLAIGERILWRGNAIAVAQSPERAIDGLLPVSMFRAVYVSNSDHYIAFE